MTRATPPATTGMETAEAQAHARRLLFLLDRHTEKFCFRAIHPRRGRAQVVDGAFDAVAEKLQKLNAEGYGIFVVVNHGGQTAKSITRVRAVFADFDGPPLPKAFPLEPHAIVQTSPGKWHVYWCTDGLDPRDFRGLQRAIAARLGSDASVCDLARIMRLPGFFHTKGEPYLSSLVCSQPGLPAYAPDALVSAFRADGDALEGSAPAKRAKTPGAAREQQISAGEGVHVDVLRVTGKLARMVREDGLSVGAAEALLQEERARGRWGREVWEEATRALRSALAKIDAGVWTVDRTAPVTWPRWLPDAALPVAANVATDLANGLRLFRAFCSEVIHVPGLSFRVWSEHGWQEDEAALHRRIQRLGALVTEEALLISRQAVDAADSDERDQLNARAEILHKWARMSSMRRTMEAGLSQLQPLVTVPPEQLDADPWKLGCLNGAVDLRNGEQLGLVPEHLLTYRTAAPYDPAARCPLWEDTVERVLPEREAREFFQRFAGYLLTGETSEQVLLVAYGTGANGKSTLFNTIAEVMGDYAKSAPPGLLMKRVNDPHPTELAYLRGRRLILAAESPEGGRLNEERVKALTGGDRVTARGMRQDFFTFLPSHKFVLLTNHKPEVRGADNGIWRRILLLPFKVTLSTIEQDTTLTAKLREEAAGILAWLVRGCITYQRDGLSPPNCVLQAVEAFREESDPICAFLEDECVIDPNLSISVSELYAIYTDWALQNDETPLLKQELGDALRARGFSQGRTSTARMWQGIRGRWMQ